MNDFLLKLGLSNREIAVYIAGLELGKAKASSIARKAEMSRPHAYHALEDLQQRGLVSKTGPKHGAFFEMEQPEKLHYVLEKRKKELSTLADELPKAAAQLNALRAGTEGESSVRVYEGKEALQKVAWEVLDTQEKEVRSLAPIRTLMDTLPPSFYKQWFAERNRRKIHSRSIWSNENRAAEYASPYRELRLPPEGMEFESTLFMYDNSVLIISPPPTVAITIITNEQYAGTMKAMFDQLWEQARIP